MKLRVNDKNDNNNIVLPATPHHASFSFVRSSRISRIVTHPLLMWMKKSNEQLAIMLMEDLMMRATGGETGGKQFSNNLAGTLDFSNERAIHPLIFKPIHETSHHQRHVGLLSQW